MNNKSKKLITKIISSGIDKLLSYLSKVTGESFVNEFITAIQILYNKRNEFLNNLNLEKVLLHKKTTNWFLVVSAHQLKK